MSEPKTMEDVQSVIVVLEAVKALSDSLGEVLKDGKIGLTDISELPELFSVAKSMVDAMKGVPAELKDLDAEEIKEVLSKAVEVVVYIGQKFKA